MPPAVSVSDLPPRANALIHRVAPVEDVIAALKDLPKGKVVLVSDPTEKQGTARNMASEMTRQLAEHSIQARGHVIPKDGKYIAGVSNQPPVKAAKKGANK